MSNFEAILTQDSETIVALATPHGRGGIAVIRVSGSNIHRIATQLLGHVPKKDMQNIFHFYRKMEILSTKALFYIFLRQILLQVKMFSSCKVMGGLSL